MRKLALNFSVSVETDEPTNIVLDVPSTMRLDRLWLETPPWPFWLKLIAYMKHVPNAVLRTAAIAFRLLFFSHNDSDAPDLEEYPDYIPPSPWPSFKPPIPRPPVIIMNIRINKDNLLREPTPADLFKEESLRLVPTCSPKSTITLVVKRTCYKTYMLRGCFLGSVIESVSTG